MTDTKKLMGTLKEISNSMTRVEGEKSLQKEAVEKAAEEHQIEKKLIKKLAKTWHKQNFAEEKGDNDEFETLYESITGGK